jgi:hypothetical protein
MLKSNRALALGRWLGIAVVVGGWLYLLAFGFHYWAERAFFGGLMVDGLTGGILFERWRKDGDRLAKVPFIFAAVAFAAAIVMSGISPRVLTAAGGIAAAGAVAAWITRAVRRDA